MKRLCQVLVVIMACAVAHAQQGNNQANIGGLLIASNFAQWTVPQGNQGGYSWSSPDFCKVTFAGVTFNAFSNGTPVQIVDTGNPGNSETVTVVKFHSQVNGCSIQVNPTHVHNTFFFRSSTGGLGEAMAFAGTQLYQVILTPDWTKLGGNTGLVTSQAGNTNVTIMDQRSAVLTPYLWSGSAYVAQPFSGGGGPPTGAATGVLSGFYPGPGLAASGALPNGWTVTTQSAGDNSGKAASTAYADAAGARFPGSNGIVFNTSAIASRNAVANDLNTIYGYTPLSPSYFGTLPGCGTAGFVFTPASANCLAAAGGTPGGSNTQVQFNSGGAFGGDSTFTFNNSTKLMQALNLGTGPLGTANSGANFNSGTLQFCGSYWDGSSPQPACGTIQTVLTAGTIPYSVTTFGFTSPGGGQFNFPFSNFINGFTIQGFTSGAVQVSATAASGNYQIILPPQNPNSGSTFLSCAPLDTSHCQGSWVAGGGGSGAVTPASFGGHGDAFSVANGCTTNGTTTVVCPAAPFTSALVDVGKEIDIWGAGAAGVSFKGTITGFTSNTTVTVNATPPTNVTQNPTIFGHDDASAIQACWNASSVSGVQCIMGTTTPNSFLTAAGYLVSSAGLTIPTHANITGNSFYEGTTIFGEFNGDLVSLPTSVASVGAGQPIVGVNFANLSLFMDPTLANGRGIHLNAVGGVFGPGGIYASTFSNIMVENAAKECLWSDGSVTGADLPNQVLTFNMFYCNLPNQMHTAAAINITGAHAQVIFENGQINGSTTHSNEPNPLISFSGSGGKFPADVKFIGYTCEVATTCLYFGPSTTNLHYDSGYMEQVDNALIADTASQGFTFNGNHLANVGNGVAVAQFLGGVTGSMRDNYVYGGSTPTAWAVCSGSQNVVVQSGNNGTNLQTSGCALSIAVSGGTQNANSCSADTNITMPGITTDSVITVGYGSASEAGVAGWGTTGGMRILARPSALNTMSWHLCNPTSGNITYGAYTFKWGFTQQ